MAKICDIKCKKQINSVKMKENPKKVVNFLKFFQKSVDINFKVWYINNAIAEKGVANMHN